jgi:hypothetical protein
MRLRYSLSDYDKHFCLKPPVPLWAALFFLSRAVTLPFLLGLGGFAGIDQNTRVLFNGLLDWPTMVPSAIAAAVVIALVRRHPSASRPIRWVWSHGRVLLAVAALLDMLLSILISPLRLGELGDRSALPLLTALIDLYLLVYVLAARRVRDVFADFPQPLEMVSK